MAKISVWSPQAKHMTLISHGQKIEMNKNQEWFTKDDPNIKNGSTYSFLVDGKGPFPDPRSPWQPEGVQGPSCWVDQQAFEWHDSHWQQPPQSSAIFYELHVGTFTPQGTFDAIIEKLDYLIDLGITHIELMPVAEFSGERGWGYDGVFLYAPHHSYGGPEGLKRLVDACHQRGLAIVLDVVYNHIGPVGNYLDHFGPYFTKRYATPWGEAINMDGAYSDEVRKFFIDNALMWLRDYHFDGLRIDAVHAIVDTSAVHFLEQLVQEVKDLEIKLGRPFILIAESDLNDPRIIRSRDLYGYGIDAQWNEDFHHALHAILTHERERYYQDFGQLADLAKILTRGLTYDGRYSPYRLRKHGRPAVGISPHKFIGFLQNHDQIGNRALGERTCHLISPEKIKIGAALVFTAPFLPLIFQGEEWASSSPFLYFTHHADEELGKAVYEGRKREFAEFMEHIDKIPHPQAEETFQRSKLKWEELKQGSHRSIFYWYRSLIHLRRQFADLRDDQWQNTVVEYDEAHQWLIMKRGSLTVACNFSETNHTLSMKEKTILLCSNDAIQIQNHTVLLPALSVVILKDTNIAQKPSP